MDEGLPAKRQCGGHFAVFRVGPRSYMVVRLSKKNAFLTGIPTNAAIVGTGFYTKGIALQLREAHAPGAPSLGGQYRVLSGNVDTLICQHMPVGTDVKHDMATALSSSKTKSFERLRSAILDTIGVEHNATLLNEHIFKPTEWTVVDE